MWVFNSQNVLFLLEFPRRAVLHTAPKLTHCVHSSHNQPDAGKPRHAGTCKGRAL